MFDAFTIRVAKEMNDDMALAEAKEVGISILEEGDFQKNIPELIAAVKAAPTTAVVVEILCNTAMRGEKIRQSMRWQNR